MAYNGKNRKPRSVRNLNDPCCDTCQRAQYIGEGCVLCDVHNVLVRDDWQVTEAFLVCLGREYEKEA